MLREIRELGFEWTELSHGIRISLVPGILEAVNAGEMKISSLHNFCPLPMGVSHAAPNIFKFTSSDHRERENAYKHSIKTIELAAKVKARVVVLHMGRIEMPKFTDPLLDLVEKGLDKSEQYARARETVFKERKKGRDEAMARANEMLKRLAEKAEACGVRLGVENREAVEEIPLEADFPKMLEEADRPGVGYWHDTGHAQIKENLGLLNHAMHLKTMAHRLVGFHVHDVQFPGHDHSEPGTGTINFAALKPMVKPEHVKVFELHPSLKPEEVQRGAEYIYKIWGKE